MKNSYTNYQSPVGQLTLIADEKKLLAVLWEKEKKGRVQIEKGLRDASHPVLRAAVQQLDEYFSGERKKFDLPIRFAGTDFQNKVWRALRKIPYGKTLSYDALARTIGRPRAYRAVGTANGKNPLSIVVPCHRVIAKDGQLAGFAGGLSTKAKLLDREASR